MPVAERLGVVEEKPAFDARQRLDGVPTEAPELAAVLAALRSPAKQPDKDTQRGRTITDWREDIARLLGIFSTVATNATEAITSLLNYLFVEQPKKRFRAEESNYIEVVHRRKLIRL